MEGDGREAPNGYSGASLPRKWLIIKGQILRNGYSVAVWGLAASADEQAHRRRGWPRSARKIIRRPPLDACG